MNPLDMTGRRVIVTGASSGIGRATAVMLSELGATVMLVGRDPDRLNATLERLAGAGHWIARYDFHDAEGVPEWLMNEAGAHGAFHGIVHSAGVQQTVPLRIVSPEKVDEMYRVNVTSGIMLAKGFRHKSCHVPGGSIVLLASITGLTGDPALAAYSASKAAIIGVTRTLAAELAPNIRVNAVAPGLVRTEMGERILSILTAEQIAAMERRYPLGFGCATDIAGAIVFLLADTGRWITGSTLVVDGGYTAI